MLRSKQRGIILVVVMGWLALMTVATFIALTATQRQLRAVRAYACKVQAQMLAELGLLAARAQLRHEAYVITVPGGTVQWSIESIDGTLDAGKMYRLVAIARYQQAWAGVSEKVRVTASPCVPRKLCLPLKIQRLWWKELLKK